MGQNIETNINISRYTEFSDDMNNETSIYIQSLALPGRLKQLRITPIEMICSVTHISIDTRDESQRSVEMSRKMCSQLFRRKVFFSHCLGVCDVCISTHTSNFLLTFSRANSTIFYAAPKQQFPRKNSRLSIIMERLYFTPPTRHKHTVFFKVQFCARSFYYYCLRHYRLMLTIMCTFVITFFVTDNQINTR